MGATSVGRWSRVRRGWIAFCSGWWLAGIVSGVRHFFDLWTRPGTPVHEVIGVPVVVGVALPGALPVSAAADIQGSTGLPTGFTAMLVGAVIGLTVWISLPVAVRRDSRRSNHDVPRTHERLALIPYVAAGAGLGYLYENHRARGRGTLRAAGLSLATAAIAYLTAAAIVLTGGLVSFAR